MKQRNRRTFAALLAATMLLTASAGCSSGSKEASPAGSSGAAPAESTAPLEATPADGVTLTMLLGNTGNNVGKEAVFKQMEEDIGIKIEMELRPTGSEGENIVRARLASGDSPDIHVFNAGSLFATLNPVENFLDITSEPFMDRVLDSFKAAVTFDGVTYGIPAASSNTGAWLYNKQIYADLGLEVPHTWAQLMENCEAIKAAGKTAVIASFATDWTAQLILLADFYNVYSNAPDFAADFNNNKDKYATNPYAGKAFEHMEEVWNRGLYNADYNATTFDQALKMLADGEGAHYPMLTHAVSNIATNYGADAANGLGAFAQPGDNPDDHGLTVWMPDAYYFYKGSDHVEDMKRFAEYYLAEDSIALFAANQAADGPYVVKNATLPDDTLAPIKDLLVYFDSGKTAPALEFITSVKGPNSPQICIQVAGGMVDAKTGAEEYDKDVEKQAKQLGLDGW